jgi:excisionase family DNA binding protein
MAIPFRERITCTVGEACNATGLGRTKLYELIKRQQVATTKVGARTLVNVESLISAVGGTHDRADRVHANCDGSGAAS